MGEVCQLAYRRGEGKEGEHGKGEAGEGVWMGWTIGTIERGGECGSLGLPQRNTDTKTSGDKRDYSAASGRDLITLN